MSCTLKGIEGAKGLRDLIDSYVTECARIDQFKADVIKDAEEGRFAVDELTGYVITRDERLEVFERRRDRIANQLENKGIKVANETADPLPSVAKALAEQADHKTIDTKKEQTP